MLPAPAARPLSWLLARAFIWSSRETAALVRTTLALVRISAGVSDNVLPQLGSLTFNLRSHPGTSWERGERNDCHDGYDSTSPDIGPLMFTAEASHEAILEYFRAAIAGAGVSGTAEVLNGSHFGPIPGITSSDGPHFRAVKQAIQEVWRYNNESVRGRRSKVLT